MTESLDDRMKKVRRRVEDGFCHCGESTCSDRESQEALGSSTLNAIETLRGWGVSGRDAAAGMLILTAIQMTTVVAVEAGERISEEARGVIQAFMSAQMMAAHVITLGVFDYPDWDEEEGAQ